MIPLSAWIALIAGILLLLVSAYMSMSETAFFSLTPSHLEELKASEKKRDKIVLKLLSTPQKLLATILIGNNFVNIVITLLLAYFTAKALPDNMSDWLTFLIETVLITFLLLLFGEITPKVFATVEPLRMARFSAGKTSACQPFYGRTLAGSGTYQHRY